MYSIFILFAVDKEDKYYYISSINPIIWDYNFSNAKVFNARYNAEYSILRDYDNYNTINKLIQSGVLKDLYVAEYINSSEVRRDKIL